MIIIGAGATVAGNKVDQASRRSTPRPASIAATAQPLIRIPVMTILPLNGHKEMKWKSEYATGIHNIDHQHREIVEIISLYEKDIRR